MAIRGVLKWAGGLVLVSIIAVGSWYLWHRHVVEIQDRENLVAAQKALAEKRYGDALKFVTIHGQQGRKTDRDGSWREVQVQVFSQLRLPIRLVALFDENAELVMRNEDASLLLVRALQERRREADVKKIRGFWDGKETQKSAWLITDADLLCRQGKRKEAVTLLQSKKLNGAEDCDRLLRLALLSGESAEQAVKYLDDAFKADPRNPDVRLFRAQLLESRGRVTEARVEYMAASAMQPGNPLMMHQLAEFYQRIGNYVLAADAWAAAMKVAPLDFIWLKSWFWSRVADSVAVDWKATRSLDGDLKALNDRLATLPATVMWDDNVLKDLPQSGQLISARQELYWLRLIQYLKEGKDRHAALLLRNNPFFDDSWAPNLETALKHILNVRLGEPKFFNDIPSIKGENIHAFYVALRERASAPTPASGPASRPAPELAALLESRQAIAAAFLAQGWLEAALFLNDPGADMTAMPDWLPYGLAQAINITRGPKAGLEFARSQRKTPILNMLMGEMLLASGDRAAAGATLAPLAKDPTPAGLRAAILLALDSLEQKNPDAAAAFVENNPTLKAATQGKEILARCLLAQNKKDQARKLYLEIRNVSPVATDFLAEEAFALGNWDEAEKLTRELASLYPDEPRYINNLRAIAAARVKASPASKPASPGSMTQPKSVLAVSRPASASGPRDK